MNNEHVLKGTFEGIKFRPAKYREFSAPPSVDPTMARVLLNKHRIQDLEPVSEENECCTSQHTYIPIVELISE